MSAQPAVGVGRLSERVRGGHRVGEINLVGVQVPATSANLGPGYDALGVALDVPLVAVAGPRREERVVSTGFGGGELPTGDDNLVWRAVLAWCDHVDAAPPDVSIEVRSAIPLERGMGSSSAAAVAGLALGRLLVGGRASSQQLVALATQFEGHPDNAAAAILGGLVLCLPDGTVRRVTPAEGLRPVLLVPAERQSTGEARAALPAKIALDVAAGNAARAAATFAGLAGLVPLSASAMSDELHEPTRLELMPISRGLVGALREAGVPAALSGAGPSVLAVVAARDEQELAKVHDVVSDVATSVEVVATRWDLSGLQVCPPGP